jgi:DNA mismatch repair protein MutS2
MCCVCFIKGVADASLQFCPHRRTALPGATAYIEPAPAVDLNNREIELAAREEEAEAAVMARLSAMLAGRAPQLASLVASVAELDIAAARGRHAQWMGSVKPQFVSR